MGFVQKLPSLIPNEKPSLIHGDLWSGNVMTDANGQVALVDPACYYGLREAELAFTTMFGGFDTSFYEAYHEVYPIENGFGDRIPIYNLYPLMVHESIWRDIWMLWKKSSKSLNKREKDFECKLYYIKL
jgi:fructosamine-3-kinase